MYLSCACMAPKGSSRRQRLDWAVKSLEWQWGSWYEASTSQAMYEAATGLIYAGDVLEVEVRDQDGSDRGGLLCCVTRQRSDARSGLPLLEVTPLAAELPAVAIWMKEHLVGTGCVHLLKDAASPKDFTGCGHFVLVVHRWRLRTRAHIDEAWAAHLHAEGGMLRPGGVVNPDSRPAAALQPVAAPALDPAMEQLGGLASALGMDLGRSDGPSLLPPRGPPEDGLRTPRPGDVDGGLPLPGTPVGRVPSERVLDWAVNPYKAVVVSLIQEAENLRQGLLQPGLSVREKLSARAGHVHLCRLLRRELLRQGLEDDVAVPVSDDDGDLRHLVASERRSRRKEKEQLKRKRSKKKEQRKGSRKRRRDRSSSSSTSTCESSDSLGGEQGRNPAASSSTRAAEEAAKHPHNVLLASMHEISGVMVKTSLEPEPTLSGLFKSLPAVYMPYFTQILRSTLEASGGGPRAEREALTLCSSLDLLLMGKTLRAIMVLLGRLKAIRQSAKPGGGGWAVAQYHEVVPFRDAGLLTARDQLHVSRDFRDAERLRRDLIPQSGPDRRGGGRAGGRGSGGAPY